MIFYLRIDPLQVMMSISAGYNTWQEQEQGKDVLIMIDPNVKEVLAVIFKNNIRVMQLLC